MSAGETPHVLVQLTLVGIAVMIDPKAFVRPRLNTLQQDWKYHSRLEIGNQ